MTLVVAIDLLLNITLLVICFRGAIIDMEEVFLGRVVGEEIFEFRTHISMKAPKYGTDFSTGLIERSISHHRG